MYVEVHKCTVFEKPHSRVISGLLSNWKDALSDILQGSVLTLVLFNVFINYSDDGTEIMSM